MKNKAITTLQKEVSPLVKTASKYSVANVAQARKASEFLKKVSDTLKTIEEKRLSFTAPLNQSLREINDTFRDISSPLLVAKGLVSSKILAWRRIEADKIAKEEERRRKIQEAHEKAGHNVNEPIELARPQAKIGNSQARKIWKWRMVAFSKLDDAYKTTNDVYINQKIREGERDIEGLEIYQEEVMSIV
jgi:hypothetical protein